MKYEKPLDRRVKRSRKMMQEALLGLLETREYPKISVSEITDAADVARTTFYSHFQTKDELLLSYIDDIFETFFSKLQQQYTYASPSSLEHKIPLMLLEEWQKNKEALERIRSANVDHMIYRRIRENHENVFQAEAEQVLGASSNPIVEGYIASFISASVFAILIQWTDNGMQEPAESVAKLLHALIQRDALDSIREAFHQEISGG